MLAKSWKKILIIIVSVLCFFNVAYKLVQVAPYAKQINSVVTNEAFTEQEIREIKERQIKNKLINPEELSKTLELNSEGKYVEKNKTKIEKGE